ncbi:MAG TPA: CopG family antitoxin [Pyrinomonadaceae bacterium]|nr:CopG family antitoxin [Pyrinomonadaceae bacterium]
MGNAKSKGGAKRSAAPLPEHFQSLERAAEFWDEHDSAPYEEHMSEVECEVVALRSAHLVPLDDALYWKVRPIAKEKGVGTDALVNRWIEEKAS